MTSRRHYLVSYDIASDKEGDKRRNKVFEACQQRGDHAQFSVFFCQLNPRELAELKQVLINIVDHRADQVLIIDLGPGYHSIEDAVDSIGKTFGVQSRVLVV
jgi:CRISPR-associated protein Cas2